MGWMLFPWDRVVWSLVGWAALMRVTWGGFHRCPCQFSLITFHVDISTPCLDYPYPPSCMGWVVEDYVVSFSLLETSLLEHQVPGVSGGCGGTTLSPFHELSSEAVTGSVAVGMDCDAWYRSRVSLI